MNLTPTRKNRAIAMEYDYRGSMNWELNSLQQTTQHIVKLLNTFNQQVAGCREQAVIRPFTLIRKSLKRLLNKGRQGLSAAMLWCLQAPFTMASSVSELDQADYLLLIDPRKAINILAPYEQQATDELFLYQEQADQDRQSERLYISAQAHLELAEYNEALADTAQAQKVVFNSISKLKMDLLYQRILWQKNRSSAEILPKLEVFAQEFAKQFSHDHSTPVELLRYQFQMLSHEVYTKADAFGKAETCLKRMQEISDKATNLKTKAFYHLLLGRHFFRLKNYYRALTPLLQVHWLAIEGQFSPYLAEANYLISRIFYQHAAYPQAIMYALDATSFYQIYPDSPRYLEITRLVGDIYFAKEEYKKALEYYLININMNQSDDSAYVENSLGLIRTYLALGQHEKAQQVMHKIRTKIPTKPDPKQKAGYLQIQGQLYLTHGEVKRAIVNFKEALALSVQYHLPEIERLSLQQLTLAFENREDFPQALFYLKKLQRLNRVNNLNTIRTVDYALNEKKKSVQDILYLKNLRKRTSELNNLSKIQRSNISILTFICIFLLLVIICYHWYVKKMRVELSLIEKIAYSHSRSSIENFRMFNQQMLQPFNRERYLQLNLQENNDLISQPIRDNLKFILFSVQDLLDTYYERGYQSGIVLEEAFGQYLANQVSRPNQLYQLFDSCFLYIEHQLEDKGSTSSHQSIFHKVADWIDAFQFHGINHNMHFRAGIIDYPVAPNTRLTMRTPEILDMLFLSLELAQQIEDEKQNHWVSLQLHHPNVILDLKDKIEDNLFALLKGAVIDQSIGVLSSSNEVEKIVAKLQK